MGIGRQRRESRHKAMLLWAAAIFVGAQLTASVLFDYVFPRVRFVYLFRKLDVLAELPRRPAVVFLGSSRTETCLMDVEIAQELRRLGADPQLDVFNAGVPCGDLVTCRYVLDEILDRGERPSLALIELSPEWLHRDEGYFSWQVRRVARWHEIADYAEGSSRHGYGGLLAETRLMPLHPYRDSVWNALSDWGQHLIRSGRTRHGSFAWDDVARRAAWERGMRKNNKPKAGEKESLEQQWRAKADTYLSGYAPGGRALRALESMLHRCREHDIRVLLWTPPLTTVRRDAYRAEVERAFTTVIDDLQQRYGCSYYDARAALPDDAFVDTHHATADGALAFSRLFTRATLHPVWCQESEDRDQESAKPRDERSEFRGSIGSPTRRVTASPASHSRP